MAKTADAAPAAALVAHSGVRLAGQRHDRPYFVATNDDPQLIWRPQAGDREAFRHVRAVRITFRGQAHAGALVDPMVFVDWGDGFDPDHVTPLRFHDGEWLAHVAARGRRCRTVRFDPSTAECEFSIEAFSVEPVGTLDPLGPLERLLFEVKDRLGPLQAPARRVWRRLSRAANTGRASLRALRDRLAGRSPWRAVYDHGFAVARQMRSPHFAAPIATPVTLSAAAPRIIAFYLPQFHPFPENDAWWGKGFTEWTNVSKAQPQFVGHYQPRLPADLGYYDLRLAETLKAQTDLARSAGLSGFCLHYYWFAGRRLLERPLDLLVSRPDIDFPFALCWANENWTRRWDGEDNELLMSQAHSPEDDVAVLDDLARYMRDPRYIRVDGKPLLIVYRPDILPDAAATTARWRARAREIGLGELHLMATTAFGYGEYAAAGFDGLADFPPHAIRTAEINDRLAKTNPAHAGRVYDYPAVVEQKIGELARIDDPAYAPGVMPGWDNEARKPGAGHVFHDADPQSFHRWLESACRHALAAKGPGLVFVNAWNEWAEGAYLEPDRWFGHGYLQAVREVTGAYGPRLAPDAGRVFADGGFLANRPTIVLHLYYDDLTDHFGALCAERDANVLVTVPDHWSPEALAEAHRIFPTAEIIVLPNRGRDILPFLKALRRVRDLGGEVFCKIHSKKSPHMAGGESWREQLVQALAGESGWRKAVEAFAQAPDLGLLATAGSRTSLADPSVMHHSRRAVNRLSSLLGITPDSAGAFPAGSMFWGRVPAFSVLLDIDDALLQFEPELGRIDGTTAHALERMMGALVEARRYSARYDL